jgi:site-specific recombinase XerD
MFITGYYGALRIGELVGITYNDIKFDDWIMDKNSYGDVIVHGKGGKERIVSLPPFILDALFTYCTSKGLRRTQDKEKDKFLDIPIFNMTDYQWRGIISYYGTKILNKRVYEHLLRHSRATHLLNKGANIKEIQAFLGHDDISSTQIYLDISKEDVKKRLKELDKPKV